MFLTKSGASTKRQDQAMKQGRIGRYGSKIIANSSIHVVTLNYSGDLVVEGNCNDHKMSPTNLELQKLVFCHNSFLHIRRSCRFSSQMVQSSVKLQLLLS